MIRAGASASRRGVVQLTCCTPGTRGQMGRIRAFIRGAGITGTRRDGLGANPAPCIGHGERQADEADHEEPRDERAVVGPRRSHESRLPPCRSAAGLIGVRRPRPSQPPGLPPPPLPARMLRSAVDTTTAGAGVDGGRETSGGVRPEGLRSCARAVALDHERGRRRRQGTRCPRRRSPAPGITVAVRAGSTAATIDGAASSKAGSEKEQGRRRMVQRILSGREGAGRVRPNCASDGGGRWSVPVGLPPVV